jgi:hypothetical protein
MTVFWQNGTFKNDAQRTFLRNSPVNLRLKGQTKTILSCTMTNELMIQDTRWFTSNDEPDGIENATHNTLGT